MSVVGGRAEVIADFQDDRFWTRSGPKQWRVFCVLNGFVMPSDIGNDKATNFSGSKYSTPTVHWKRSAETAVVGFGGLAGAAFHLPVRLPAHLLRAMQHIATR